MTYSLLVVQRLKTEVRQQIVDAAAALFAREGHDATSVAAVATRAGVSTGNVYRYFPSKEALFAAVVPADFVAELQRRTRDQIEALHVVSDRDLDAIAPTSRYAVLSEELVEFSIENRERVVIVLARADGTPFSSFEADFRKDLTEWAFAYVRATWPAIPITAPLRFTVDRAYRSFLASLAAAFLEHDDPRRLRELRETVAYIGLHHRGGLKALFRELARSAERER
jgi:AcrR family transcriptional regulator